MSQASSQKPPSKRVSLFYEDRLEPIFGYGKRNPSLLVGIGLIFTLMVFVIAGYLFYDHENYRVTSVSTRKGPSFVEKMQQGTTAALWTDATANIFGDAQLLPVGETYVIEAQFPLQRGGSKAVENPFAEAATLGKAKITAGSEAEVESWVDLVAKEDYRGAGKKDGSGGDFTNNLTVTLVDKGDSHRAEISVFNNGPEDVYLTKLQARGVPLTLSQALPFGSDTQGRDLFSVAIRGIPLTLRIGIIAGAVSVGLGTIMAFVAAYYRGWPDTIIRTVVDTGMSIPSLLILILVRINIGRELSVDELGLGIAVVGWVFPARVIRAQVLVMREQAYVEIARLSGTSAPSIIFKEMVPNLIPYITAQFVASVAGAILASIGLEAIGLGKLSDPTLGMTIYWNIQFSSIVLGMWWWWLPPLITIIMVFMGLFMISAGLDEWSNPRLRKRV